MGNSILSSSTGVLEVKSGTQVKLNDEPADDAHVGNHAFNKKKFAQITALPTKIGQILKNLAGNVYSPGYPDSFMREFTIRAGKTVAVNDPVSYYGTTDTIEKNGKAYKIYTPAQADTTPASSNNARPLIIKLSATTAVILYSSDAAFTGIVGQLFTLNTDRNSPTFGGVVTIATTGTTSAAPFHACRVNDTRFVVIWRGTTASTTNMMQTVICNVAAGTFTVSGTVNQGTSGTATVANECFRIQPYVPTPGGTEYVVILNSVVGTCRMLLGTLTGGTSIAYSSATSFPSTYASPVLHASDIIHINGINGSASHGFAIMHDGATICLFRYTVNPGGSPPITIVEGSKVAAITLSNAADASYRSMTCTQSDDFSKVVCVVSRAGISNFYFAIHPDNFTPTTNSQYVAGYDLFATPAGATGATCETGFSRGDSLTICGDDVLHFCNQTIINGVTVPVASLNPIRLSKGQRAISSLLRYGGFIFKFTPSRARIGYVVDTNTTNTAFLGSSICRLSTDTFVGVYLTHNGSTVSLMTAAIEFHTVQGIALDAGSGGNSIRVQIDGVVSGTNLTKNRKYYIDEAGALSLDPTNTQIGRSLPSGDLAIYLSEVV